MKTLSIILPIHNVARELQQDVEQLVEIMPQLTDAFQIVIIDQGSDDGSDILASDLDRQFPQVTACFLPTESTVQAAIELGIGRAVYGASLIIETPKVDESKILDFLRGNSKVDRSVLESSSERNGYGQQNVPDSERLSADLRTELHLPHQKLAGSHFCLGTPVESLKPTENSEHISPDLEQPQQPLIDRLMNWGMALQKYRDQIEGLRPDASTDFPSDQSETANADVSPGFALDFLGNDADEVQVIHLPAVDDKAESMDSDSPECPSRFHPLTTQTGSPQGTPETADWRNGDLTDISVVTDRPGMRFFGNHRAFPTPSSIPERRLIQMSRRDLARS